eukprot:TRINITY_DN11644_c0_g1_i1.p1 TRINITY_DN11644_c0_g1~~TRINITY_DN11644_c0_g1_i1.p1  ORF type:complete len:167 (+),score=46.74 TRINITY_DN11644_c0_g1_i1:65-565(+)
MASLNANFSDEALKAYQLYSTKKPADKESTKRYGWLIFKLGEEKSPASIEASGLTPIFKNTEIKEEIADFEEKAFKDFVKTLSAVKEPRFACVDMYFTHKDGRFESKAVLLRWSPEGAAVKKKMIYSSSESAVKSKLGSARMYQATDAAALDLKAMQEFAFQQNKN